MNQGSNSSLFGIVFVAINHSITCMKRLFLPLLALAFTSCNGQVKTNSSKETTGGQSKIIKNHFLEFSYDFFYVQCGLQDKTGNMWFGSAGDGIYLYDGNFFVNFTHKSFINFFLKEDLNHNDILCCMEDKTGNIWFGTRRGLIRYKPNKGKAEGKDFTLFFIPKNTISSSTRTRLPYTAEPYDNFVWSIMEDNSEKIWFGTSKGIYVHNPLTDNENDEPLFTRFFDNDSLINDQQLQLINVMNMLEDRNGNIWFLSAGADAKGVGMERYGAGIVRYDGKSLSQFKPDNLTAFRSVIERKNGDLLFLNDFHGVFSYDGKSFSNLNEKIGITNDTLISMLEDQNGNLWLGHYTSNVKNGGDGGLWCYDGKSLKLFTTKDGLPHNHVMCMVEDRDGNIWFGTRNTGLCRYDGKTFTDYTE